jgi:hypothetical protein
LIRGFRSSEGRRLDPRNRRQAAAAQTNETLAIASYSDQSKLSPKTVLASALAKIQLLVVEDMDTGSVQSKTPFPQGALHPPPVISVKSRTDH